MNPTGLSSLELQRDRRWLKQDGHLGARAGAAATATEFGGVQSPWKDRMSAPGNGGRHYGLVGGV